jgi:hypothetical protein
MEIRSYRRVFDLERRVYSVDRLRLNPGGVPVRGVAYFAAILAIGALAARLPLLGGIVRALPWYLRDLALPGLAATVLGAVRVEGRAFHLTARALLRHALGPRRLTGSGERSTVERHWHPPDITWLPDGSDARMRHLRYTGPGSVLVALEHDLDEHATAGVRAARTLTLRQRPGSGVLGCGQVIALAAGTRLVVHAHQPDRG